MNLDKLLKISKQHIFHQRFLKKMTKIVSAVTRFTENNIDYVRVHYTDGTQKVFPAFEWQALVKEGKDLWDSHQDEISGIRHNVNNPERFDG